MITLSLGIKKKSYNSIQLAYEAAKLNQPELKYITFYMRLRSGKPVARAMKNPVRKYERKVA